MITIRRLATQASINERLMDTLHETLSTKNQDNDLSERSDPDASNPIPHLL